MDHRIKIKYIEPFSAIRYIFETHSAMLKMQMINKL
jgi:hypothetical protein